VLWCGRLAFAFTGLADLGDDARTDMWLAETLASIVEDAERASSAEETGDQQQLLAQLAVRATAEFRTPLISSLDDDLRGHSFVAVGWARFRDESDFSPYLACVSNLYATTDATSLNRPADEFAFWYRRLNPSEGGFFLAEGRRFSSQEQSAMVQQLGALDSAFPGPDAVVQALVDKIRALADDDELIGKGVLVNVLPRASIVPGDQSHQRASTRC
jgi:hypothetical protein